jgi:hypothetical protein
MNGEEYDLLVIPTKPFIEVDFTQFPEDDPLRRVRNIEQMMTVHLERDVDLEYASMGDGAYRLTKHGASRLFESL